MLEWWNFIREFFSKDFLIASSEIVTAWIWFALAYHCDLREVPLNLLGEILDICSICLTQISANKWDPKPQLYDRHSESFSV